MAISFIGSTSGNAINGGSITLTLPGGIAVDDLIIVAYAVGDDDFTQPALAMTTAGYTLLHTAVIHADGGTAGDASLAVFYKWHNGSDTQAITTASGTGTDSSTAAALMVFRGVAKDGLPASIGPLEIVAATTGSNSGGDPNPPSVSGFTEATSWVVIVGAVGNNTAITLTAPTNYTTNAVLVTGNDTFDIALGLAYRSSGISDPEDPGIFTDSGAGAAWAAVTMVLKERPAPIEDEVHDHTFQLMI
jgi:hypothetical protein